MGPYDGFKAYAAQYQQASAYDLGLQWKQQQFKPGAFGTQAKEPDNTIMHKLSEARAEERRLVKALEALDS